MRYSGEWTGQRELTVWIGFSAVVVPDSVSATCSGDKSCITLLEGGIRTEAFAVLSSSGSTPVLAPHQPQGVSAVLIAPQVNTQVCSSSECRGAHRSFLKDIAFPQNSVACGLSTCTKLYMVGISTGWRLYPMSLTEWADSFKRDHLRNDASHHMGLKVTIRYIRLANVLSLNSIGSRPTFCFHQEVGLCGEFTLDGRASSGSSSRTLSAVWNVETAAGGAALAAVEQALSPFQGLLLATLNTTALEIGSEFSFTLTVSNFLGAQDQTTVTVKRM